MDCNIECFNVEVDIEFLRVRTLKEGLRVKRRRIMLVFRNFSLSYIHAIFRRLDFDCRGKRIGRENAGHAFHEPDESRTSIAPFYFISNAVTICAFVGFLCSISRVCIFRTVFPTIKAFLYHSYHWMAKCTIAWISNETSSLALDVFLFFFPFSLFLCRRFRLRTRENTSRSFFFVTIDFSRLCRAN